MTPTEKECSEALCDLYNRIYGEEYSYEKEFDILSNLIQKFFSNSPLKFEDLKSNMWVWDDKVESWVKVFDSYIDASGRKIVRLHYGTNYFNALFNDNRFYKKERSEC